MRTFLAIELPEEVTLALGRLSSAVPVGRPVPNDNLHLTLAFLGDQPDEKLEQLHHDLESISTQLFDLGFDGLGCFGKDPPKVLYARITENDALNALHKKIRRAAHRADVILSRERFTPHVTLARFNRSLQWRGAERLEGFIAEHALVALPTFTVSGFTLFQSVLHPDGAVYDELAHYGFG